MSASVAYPYFQPNSDVWIFGIMFCVGMGLVFLPNALVGALKSFLSANSNKKL